MIRIDGYLIDASLSEIHTDEAEVTSYPTSAGADVTDNVRILPRRVLIEGIVSDSPSELVAIERRGASGSDVVIPSKEALAKLDAIFAAREQITIETALRVYDRMIMIRKEVPIDGTTGAALRFTCEFREIRIVENTRTTVRTRVSVPRAARRRDLGSKTPAQNEGPITAFVDPTTGVPRRVQYNPDKGYVDADTGKPLTQAEGAAWTDQNGGDPRYKSPRELGPGGHDRRPKDRPSYWADHTDPPGPLDERLATREVVDQVDSNDFNPFGGFNPQNGLPPEYDAPLGGP